MNYLCAINSLNFCLVAKNGLSDQHLFFTVFLFSITVFFPSDNISRSVQLPNTATEYSYL